MSASLYIGCSSRLFCVVYLLKGIRLLFSRPSLLMVFSTMLQTVEDEFDDEADHSFILRDVHAFTTERNGGP